ncbi:MAG: hypothetical protein M3Q08_19095 [Pseudomonadota bacterium]|nr:hypothetical protein [Pseudomonadota bacterium]
MRSIFAAVESRANRDANHPLFSSMSTRARTFVAAGLSELSQKIEQIGRNLFLNGALVDGSKRRSDFPARRRHLFGLLFAGLDEGGLIGFAPAIGALLVLEAQDQHPSRLCRARISISLCSGRQPAFRPTG